MYNLSVLYYIFILVLLPILWKRINLYTFVWQYREYRFDRLIDYFTINESKKVLWDSWTLLRILLILLAGFWFLLLFFLPYLVISLDFENNPFIIATIIILFGSHLVEVLHITLKLLKNRQFLKPKWSLKARIIALVSWVIILTTLLLGLYYFGFLYLIVFSTIFVLIIPVVVSLVLGLVWPLDYYLKFRIKQQALTHRQGLTNLQVVAISGSYGKSTTKEYLMHILNDSVKAESTKKFQNTTLSCARAILKLDSSVEVFVCELGSYKKGDGQEVCEFILPTMATITGLNLQHLALFNSRKAIIEGESEAVDFLESGQSVIINYDSEMCQEVEIPDRLDVVKYGFGEYLDCRINSYSLNSEGQTEFSLTYNNQKISLVTNVITRGNVQNLTAAIISAKKLGVTWDEIKKKILSLPQPEETLCTHHKSWGVLIDDTHNANPDGVLNALEVFQIYKGDCYLVIDDILELGNKTEEELLRVSTQIAKICPKKVILCGRNYSILMQKQLQQLGYSQDKITISSNRKFEAKKLSQEIQITQKPSCILLEGYLARDFVTELK